MMESFLEEGQGQDGEWGGLPGVSPFLAFSSQHQEVRLLVHLGLMLHKKPTVILGEKKVEFSSLKVLISSERCFRPQSPNSPHLRAGL